MEDKSYYRSLTRKMLLVMILVSFTPLVLISGIIGYRFETSYRYKVLAHLRELVQKHQQNINGYLSEKLSYIRILSDSYSFEQLSREPFLQQRLSILQKGWGEGVVDLGLVDEQGNQIAYAGPFKLRNANYSEAEWFKQAMQRPCFVSDVFFGLRGLPHFIIAVRQESAGVKWILRATVDFVAFNNLVGNIQIGHTGMAFILNTKGELQTKPRMETHLSRDFFLDMLPKIVEDKPPTVEEPGELVSDPTWLYKGLEERVTTIEGVDHAGTPAVLVMTLLKSGEWVLVYQQEMADAFADLINARRLAITIFFLGGLGILAMAYALSRRMVNRIAEADMEKEMMNERVIEAGKLASLGELAAGIAHEINNPVAIMVEKAGWIEDLMEEEDFAGAKNIDEFTQALGQIRAQGTRCREITHKLLSFARKTDHRAKMVQLNDVIDDVIGLSDQRAKLGNIQVKTDLAKDLPIISISPAEMQQVFLNLINNALDALEEKKSGEISISTRVEGESIMVDIADNGEGIPKSSMQRIFDPFYTTKPVGKGTGLGLSICYGIVKKWGGFISVDSIVGSGATFHINVPISPEKRESPESRSSGSSGPGPFQNLMGSSSRKSRGREL